ncbi:MAG TPA: DJ-1/PfpI family protein, partial [Novosphingobium sp.]
MAVDVRVFLYNESEFLTLSSILKPLSSVVNFLPDYARPGYDVSLCSFEGGEIEGPWGCHVSTRSINDFTDCAHTFVICGGPGFEAALNVPGLIDAMRRQAAGAKRLCVAGAGVFLAAEAGLISTEAVAAHTSLAPWLKLRHPQLRPDNTALLVGDDLLLTCAGFSAGIDLALTLIERDWGYRIAVNVAKYLMVYKK